MCLFVIDGTWSRDFNSKSLGNDRRDIAVGNQDSAMRSNARRFYEESRYPSTKKYYYGGPEYGITGADAKKIYTAVVADIERAIVNGSCTEISLVGWSRGGAISAEIAQGLLTKEYARIYTKVSRQTRRGIRSRNVVSGQAKMLPEIKFVGLFDAVAMIPSFFGRNARDDQWGEAIPKNVNYFAHVIAGDRAGPLGGLIDFVSTNPQVAAKKSVTITLPGANHGNVGGDAAQALARQAYKIMKMHAVKAGVK